MSDLYPKRRQFFVPYNGKIADITHADTNKHTLELANAGGTGAIAGETRKIIAITILAMRIAGTGDFRTYPNEGASRLTFSSYNVFAPVIIADGTNRLQYNLSVASDDWDIYCLGYVVES